MGLSLSEKFCRTCGVLFENVFLIKCDESFGCFGLGASNQ
jgi:hypothetical protein